MVNRDEAPVCSRKRYADLEQKRDFGRRRYELKIRECPNDTVEVEFRSLKAFAR